ncbi:MAG: class I SAM-dependent methyltransferase [Myxococcales bacterium]|nr:class I SAM-dependent methyltransferase [Myxococcales bacterium]
MDTRNEPPSQFYRGLIAEMYQPLVAHHPRADDYAPFLDASGTPALELGCGSGQPLLDLVARGYHVEGLDASQDMLVLCRQAAAERGLEVTLHQAEMQSFSLPQRYRAIFLAGATFTLLTSDDDAAAALSRIHAHLEPGGSALIPLDLPNTTPVGDFHEHTKEDGTVLRVGVISQTTGRDGCSWNAVMRYERRAPGHEPEVVEREYRRRWWPQARFREMLHAAGFDKTTFIDPAGGKAAPEASLFVALARRD